MGKGVKVLFIVVMVVCTLMQPQKGSCKIPEPDNIFYGMVIVNGELLTAQSRASINLKVDPEKGPIASYIMGDNPALGDYYILRVPIDVLTPLAEDAAHPGDGATIYINGMPAGVVTIGGRGAIRILHLDTVFQDSDGDGLTDGVEYYMATNAYNPDTDGDGIPDAGELASRTNPLLYDTDNDGYADGVEIAALTDSLNGDDIPALYVDAKNTSGVEDGTKEHPYNTIAEGIAAAPEHYTVFVASSLYAENLIVDKNITIIGDTPTTTIIEPGSTQGAIVFNTPVTQTSTIQGFTIRNAANGIDCSNGASPSIRNNIIIKINGTGILCGEGSSARIINNTITGNTAAAAISSSSSQTEIVNNIISDNNIGIRCANGAMPRIDYNDLWENPGGNYLACNAGVHDISETPSFVNKTGGDFHLTKGSACINAGDPVEVLTMDYTGGTTIKVGEVTNIINGDRVWITDGTVMETDIVTGTTATNITVQGEFMNNYLVSQGSYLLTETSSSFLEPPSDNYRIDMGAYGNTEEAFFTSACKADFDGDKDVDVFDLGKFASNFGKTNCLAIGGCAGDFDNDGDVDVFDLGTFASDFGKTDCF